MIILEFIPIQHLQKGYAYDPITLNITEETDENNNSTYHEYDNFGRMINKDVLLNGDKNRIDHTNYYLSRSGNGDVFNSNDPNRLESENYFNVTDKISKCDFYDGFNKKMQDQYLEIDNIIVGNTLEYNALGSISKLYKPYPKNGTTFSYDNNYLVNSDNYYTSGLGNYGTYSATGNRPYYEIKYSSDPIQRKIQEIPEGLQWFSNNKLINYTYGGNVANDQIPLGTGTYSANSLFKNELTNENGIVTQFYNDIFGNLIAQKTNPTGLNLKTFYTFDILGNQTKKTDPKGFISTMDFNTLKLLKTKSTPDRGSVRYLYDQNSNMRFYQTSEHNTTSINSFYTNQNKIGVGSWSGTFTLVKPSLMQLYAQSFNTNSSINEKIILKIKNTTTSVVTIVELIAEDNGSLIVTKSFRLPKGSFKWEVTTTGASNSQFNFYVDSRNNMQFEYHNYDNFNRLIQSGENYYNYASSSYFQQSNADNISFPSSGKFINKDFIYDIQSTDILAVGQRNLKGRLSYTKSYIMNDLEYTSFYSYDDIGNIEWILNKWVTGKNNKIKYSYDLQRNITKQEFTGDQSFYNYYKFFEYDKLGRLVNVYTDKNSASGATKLKEITYIYNPDNSLKRMELGAEGSKAQGLDYLYNTRGWLSQINHQNINSSQDPGSDNGLNGKPQVDKFGMVIGYNNISDIGSTQSATAQWNGNISWMMYNMSGATFPSGLVGNTYSYDNANRLLSSNFGYYISSWQATSNYDVNNITYDNNGNLNTIRRYWNNGQIFDNQTFYYLSGKNQLNYVYDSGTSSISVNDVDNQSSGNYLYDGNGSMVQDAQQGIGYILYNSDNLPIKQYYINGDVVEYIYDAYGNRVTKKVVNDLIHWNYANGINGNTEARIKENSNPPVLIKHNIWGNDLAGTFEKEVYTNYVETKTYYLKDHLGNIKVRVNESGSVVGYDDYYPFGMIMNGRSNNTGTEVNYKYTSKERDLETGLDYFGARYYDSKIARWLSVDPLADKYPDWSPYNYILSNPLNGIDPNGEFTLKFIKNTYYLHRESINTAKFATFIEGFLPTLVQLGIIVKEQYFPRDPSYEVQTIGERLFSLGASYVGDNTIYSHELGNRVSKTMTFLSGFSKWKEIKPNFIYDEYLFRQLSEYNREGISAFLKGEIIGINNRTGEPLFEPSEDGLSLMLNPHYVNMFYNGNVHDAMKSIILQRQKQEDEERRAAKALNKFIDEYGKK
ncbi:MAG: RHS repeat-associated core domain-containing protein [Ignavibacteriae bacterium]|nr:RHS repeat-associated core domain-containing protein [Ignavibacteriota bacterium]